MEMIRLTWTLQKKSKPSKCGFFFRLTEMRVFIDPHDNGCFRNCLCYVPLLSENTEMEVTSPLKNLTGTRKSLSYLTSILIHQYFFYIYKILCQQGPQFSYVLLRIVFLFQVLYALTPSNNTLCPLLLDSGKQQLIISFPLSLHNTWFLRIDCILMIPDICVGSQEFSVSFLSPCTAVIPSFLIKLSLYSLPFSTGPFLA